MDMREHRPAPPGRSTPRRFRRIDAVWACANVLAWLAAIGWTALGLGLRSECGDYAPDCDDWVMADAVAVGVTFIALLGWVASRGRRRFWLGLGTVGLLVPLFHVLFV